MRLLLATLVVLFSSTTSLAQWQVRAGGDSRHSGYVDAAGPVSEDLRWQRPMAAWFGQPVFVEEDIVVTTWLTDAPMQDRGVVVAMQLQTGDTLWTRKLPMDLASDWSGYACAMRDGKVYATRAGNSNSSYVYALDALTGQTIWRSQDLTDIYVSEGPVFAENGDLLLGNSNHVTRVREADGTRVYQAARGGSMSGGREPVVVGDKYYIRHGNVGDRLAAHDLATGQFLYWSASVGTAQLGLFAGKDGTLYVPTGSSLYAFTDTGSSLMQKWVSPGLASCAFSTFAVGPDGSVYSYKVVSGSVVLVRLDPVTGQQLNVSPAIVSGTTIIPGHMAVDRSGTLFVTNGAYDMYSFNPDLTLRWRVPLPRSEGGPSLAADGTMLVGANTGVLAYAPDPAGLTGNEIAGTEPWSQCLPNPFGREAAIRFDMPAAGSVSLGVYDLLGREVRRVEGGARAAGIHELRLDGSGLPNGVYFYRLQAGERVDQKRVLLMR